MSEIKFINFHGGANHMKLAIDSASGAPKNDS